MLLRILANPLIPAADSQLSNIAGKYYVAKSVRLPGHEGLELKPLQDKYELVSGVTVALADIRKAAEAIFEQIASGANSAFAVPFAQKILQNLGLSSMKADSSQKIDIQLELPSMGGGQDLLLGFSIKSQMGSSSTLLNHSGATAAIFNVPRLLGSTENYYDSIRLGYTDEELTFDAFANTNFQDNLEFFGSDFPKKLADLVKAYLFAGTSRSLREQVILWAGENGGQIAEEKLKFQLKSFLRAVALGLRPSKLWAGELDGYGGYIVVKRDGEVMCLHLENDEAFKTYLYENTKFDLPSSARIKHTDANDAAPQVSVPLQIRFLK